VSPQQQRRALHLLSAAVVLGALFVLWQTHTFVGWCVLALLLAVVLNPAGGRQALAPPCPAHPGRTRRETAYRSVS
jgi:hypothetical protein